MVTWGLSGRDKETFVCHKSVRSVSRRKRLAHALESINNLILPASMGVAIAARSWPDGANGAEYALIVRERAYVYALKISGIAEVIRGSRMISETD
jgi:hypothetical protein